MQFRLCIICKLPNQHSPVRTVAGYHRRNARVVAISRKAPATKKTTAPKIGEELVATEEQVVTAHAIAQLQAEVNDSGILEKLAEIDELKKTLIGQFHGTELQDLTITLQDGTTFKISRPSTTSTIDREKVKKYLGNAQFMKLATVSVTG